LDIYQYVSFARQYGLDIKKFLQTIVVSRMFTIYQLANTIIYELPKIIIQHLQQPQQQQQQQQQHFQPSSSSSGAASSSSSGAASSSSSGAGSAVTGGAGGVSGAPGSILNILPWPIETTYR
jgi:hypothetical protein